MRYKHSNEQNLKKTQQIKISVLNKSESISITLYV